MSRRFGATCGLCGGSGGVSVWSTLAEERMAAGWEKAIGDYNGYLNVTMCACKCPKGEPYKKKNATYDEKTHLIRVANVVDSVGQLLEFVHGKNTVAADDSRGRQWKFEGDE